MRKTFGLVLASLLVVSCGSGSSSTPGLCGQIGTATCQKACSCREGPTCALSQGGLTLTFDTEADCRLFLVTAACSEGDMAAYNNAAACLPLIQAATCTGTGVEGAVSLPPDTACETPP
jgi:hypothetical protein